MSGAGGAPQARIGIMGGTFDPIHHGHLVCAQEAFHQFDLNEIVFIPAGNPWQKTTVTSAEDRFRMTVIATADNGDFSVSRIEIETFGPTYTANTLEALQDHYGESTQLYFISGADAVQRILTWKQPEAVLSGAKFIAASRPDFDLSGLTQAGLEDRVTFMKIPSLAISSSDIRRRVAEGRPIRYLVPAAVAEFILERGLYRQAR
ncbi:MAG: nicotinate-nucleotide adenylyltransferase [Actinomycetota bacterium]